MCLATLVIVVQSHHWSMYSDAPY